MKDHLLETLKSAKGRSEFVVVCVVDIRGFSEFSTRHESPDIAMFIKRFYSQALTQYFPSANFAKPTGDGLLLTFPYDENTLESVSHTVIGAAFDLLQAFPTICQNDPMVNFPVPTKIGIGITRGTACCLHSDDYIIDYSGHLLNLASRIMELARPSGIVIDGNYSVSLFPNEKQGLFQEEKVYIRGIADEVSRTIFYTKDLTVVPHAALAPLTADNWQSEILEWQYNKLLKLASRYHQSLPGRLLSHNKIIVKVTVPKKRMPGVVHIIDLPVEYIEKGTEAFVVIPMEHLRGILAPFKFGPQTKIRFNVQYVLRLQKPKK